MNGRTINISPQANLPSRGTMRFWAIVITFLTIYLLVRFGIGLYIDYLWFDHLGLASVYFTQLGSQLTVGLGVGLAVAAIFVTNALIARWLSIRNILFFSDEILVSQKIIIRLIGLVGLILAWLMGSAASLDWLIFRRYLAQQSFGLADPIFQQDVGFYIFSLPVMNFMQSWLLFALFLAMGAALAVYALAQQTTLAEGRFPVILPHIQLHMSILGALIFLTVAWGHWLSRFALLYSERGVAFGASYTDISVSLPALQTMSFMALIAAIILILNIFLNRQALSLAVVFVWLIISTLGLGIVPSVVQRYVVEPNELARETPYIKSNIDFTNLAYRLDHITERDFAKPTILTPAIAERNATTLNNIRLWDYRPLQQTYQQIQAIRLYYHFNDIDLDRYIVNNELRQVALAPRELDKSRLQQTWVTQKLQFTHGYGVVVNPINEVTKEGLPRLWVQDLPPRTSVGLTITRPEIYYGESTDDYVFVKTTEREFDYPSGDENVYSQYEGNGGVIMGSYLKKIAFAIYLSDVNMLLSQEFTADSRVMLYRNIKERVSRIAPFLEYDHDPYLVIGDDGHLYWLQDAYTTSDLFPYSEPTRQFNRQVNYVRNSVKVVIDAYNGNLTFYIVDETDPLIKAYQQIFPDLFTPLAAMPADLRSHLRYPEDLFRIQSQLFQIYHMRDVNVFYNKEDLWQLPKETYQGETQTVEPYYVILALPGEVKEEFALIQPFTPVNKDNMIAWLAARTDGDHYGELMVIQFPKQEMIFGPLQIEARIDQDPEISSQLTLWNQSGSSVIRGNLLVLPLEDTLLYVEPLYLQAESGQIPELKRVIVASGDQIVMAETFAAALKSLFIKSGVDNAPPPPSSQPTTNNLNLDTASIATLAESASSHYNAAQAALRRGDWAVYGEELRQMEAALNALLKLTRAPK